jgi:hypothetical protein
MWDSSAGLHRPFWAFEKFTGFVQKSLNVLEFVKKYLKVLRFFLL